MKTLPYYSIVFLLCFSFIGVSTAGVLFSDENNGAVDLRTTSSTDLLANTVRVVQEQSQGFSVENIWALTEQAGPLRWPIFAVFLIGMFLVFFKLYELSADRRESKEIEDLDFRTMNIPQIVRAISGQRESLLSRLHATMLNVYQSQRSQAELHEEIANYINHQQDRFDTFKRRIDFLADTAGALGLLGTVWGIFSVFSQGMVDDQIVLAGMGVALLTTLLGLVVSIILNLSSTEVFSFFNKRLDRVTEKSDELRFRLMELSPIVEEPVREMPPMPEIEARPSVVSSPMTGVPFQPRPSTPPQKELPPILKDKPPAELSEKKNDNLIEQQQTKPIAQVEAVFKDRISNNVSGDAPVSIFRKPLVESSVQYPKEPHELSFVNAMEEGTVGKKIRNLCLLLVDNQKQPISSRKVEIKVEEGGSTLNDAKKEYEATTDENGEVHFDLQFAKKAGKQLIVAHVPESEASCKHTFLAKPGVPRKLKQFGNNQGGAAGEVLAKALKVQVLDEFENPISDWNVAFAIELGGGSFENNKPEIKVKTNGNGEGVTQLRVGKEPGFNTVKAAVEGVVKELKFQAMSMA